MIKTKYTKEELEEFKVLILGKIAKAKEEFYYLNEQFKTANENDTVDTSGEYLSMEDGTASYNKESIGQLANRMKKFIDNLESALVRIENGTYGVCKVTGKLISKERLRAVPHTTQSIEAKLDQYK